MVYVGNAAAWPASDTRSSVLAVEWLQRTLQPGLTDEEATEHFEGLIFQAMSERRDRIFRDLAHIWAHGK